MRLVMHGFCYCLQFSMAFSTFGLEVTVELLEGAKPGLKFGNEMDLFVMGMCPSSKGEVHACFDMVLKLCII